MRIVLDTSVVVAGLRTRLGAGNAVLREVARQRLIPLASPPLFLEYEDVMKRPEHRLVHGMSLEAIDEFLAEFAALIEPLRSISNGDHRLQIRMTKWCWKPPSTAGQTRS